VSAKKRYKRNFLEFSHHQAKQEEEARKIREQQEKESGKTNNIQVASQRQAQLGGYGLLYGTYTPPSRHLHPSSRCQSPRPPPIQKIFQ
jgi:hypothetical protein